MVSHRVLRVFNIISVRGAKTKTKTKTKTKELLNILKVTIYRAEGIIIY